MNSDPGHQLTFNWSERKETGWPLPPRTSGHTGEPRPAGIRFAAEAMRNPQSEARRTGSGPSSPAVRPRTRILLPYFPRFSAGTASSGSLGLITFSARVISTSDSRKDNVDSAP